ncbi:MAG: hypothetical protein NXY57DRAFT_1069093 [Lentinula lateritia]|nr:MAG: hypothetical protein NXY57DRAFT_1069093 [Lentinula lateritia]
MPMHTCRYAGKWGTRGDHSIIYRRLQVVKEIDSNHLTNWGPITKNMAIATEKISPTKETPVPTTSPASKTSTHKPTLETTKSEPASLKSPEPSSESESEPPTTTKASEKTIDTYEYPTATDGASNSEETGLPDGSGEGSPSEGVPPDAPSQVVPPDSTSLDNPRAGDGTPDSTLLTAATGKSGARSLATQKASRRRGMLRRSSAALMAEERDGV